VGQGWCLRDDAGAEATRPRGVRANEVLVVDEWPGEASFQAFFENSGAQIEQMMASAGVTTQPSIEFWRHLEVGDDVG
jgi:hypothetical protein